MNTARPTPLFRPGLPGRKADVAVTHNGQKAPPFSVPVTDTAPGIFTATQNGTGQGAILKRRQAEPIAKVYRNALREAAAETGVPAESFPPECPYSPEQILNETFLPSQ